MVGTAIFVARPIVSHSLLGLALLTFSVGTATPQEPAATNPTVANRPVDFARDIWPIFAERCQHCHGEREQKGQLRLDAKALVMRGGKSGPLFESGKGESSRLLQRLTTGGANKRMPLEDEPLSDSQIGLIQVWIDQGAVWPAGVGSAATELKKHWAYVVPVQLIPPVVRDLAWAENPLDYFVQAKLESQNIAYSPRTDRERLLRRVTLDLTGVPPSVAEADAFLADKAPDTYERLVDRLLALPRYGERWATPWLDAARYADSNGYQRDGHRVIWPYRDWVIRAFNADLPFDQFTREQLAGDLLPGATLDQQIATGFHRCTTVNVEAGTDQEEDRTNQIIDRVNVTGMVWLGTTLECCQCHDHKYDPFTQTDYYRLFAFFNNTPLETYQQSKGSASLDFGGPVAELPLDPAVRQRRTEIAARHKQLGTELENCLTDETQGLAAWERSLSGEANQSAAKVPANIRKLLAVDPAKRNKNQQTAIRTYFVGQHPEAGRLQSEMDTLKKQLDGLAPATTLVMTEIKEPRMTRVFERGSFLSPGKAVEPGTPQSLPPLTKVEVQSRLDLTNWLTDAANPLTGRVQVNRLWGQLFGRAIVVSEEDFGTQSEPPTHPEMLDWLTVEFRDRGWSTKRVLRCIVESATYRQSSKTRADLINRDPYNLLLARGPRVRLPAELIRDSGLTVSGLLSSKMSGPPVYPLQPDGVWRVTGAVDNTYRTSSGDDAWRRGIYTVWRRSAPYPSFVNFDAPDRSACTVKRARSNTPLQALTLQNDPVYVELARGLADRITEEGYGQTVDNQLTFAFRAALTRHPEPKELVALRTIWNEATNRYQADPVAAKQILADRSLPAGIDAQQWAAWFNVAHVLLNLDEAITKN